MTKTNQEENRARVSENRMQSSMWFVVAQRLSAAIQTQGLTASAAEVSNLTAIQIPKCFLH